MLRVNKIEIEGIGPIKSLSLTFNDHMNVICGTNGIGKTTILNCIAQTFAFDAFTLRKNDIVEKGHFTAEIKHNNEELKQNVDICVSRPLDKIRNNIRGTYRLSNELLIYKTDRTLEYHGVDSISKDPAFSEFEIAKCTTQGTNYGHIKAWLLNRYLWSKQDDALTQEQQANLQLAIDVINRMSDNIKFLKIDHETNDILLNTDKGTIVLEQLSSGFLSYILVLLGLIKDIEYRFKKPHIKVTDFEGILIIDEVDVHMHPSLQANMYHELKRILPKAQIFTSTHSPHVVQVAEPEEIISLVRDTEGGIVVNPKRSKEYGFKGWTIEEILTDVMGMTCTNSKTFSDLILEFNDAVKKEDQKKAAGIYEKIDKMLHPDNILRQVLKLQLE